MKAARPSWNAVGGPGHVGVEDVAEIRALALQGDELVVLLRGALGKPVPGDVHVGSEPFVEALDGLGVLARPAVLAPGQSAPVQ